MNIIYNIAHISNNYNITENIIYIQNYQLKKYFKVRTFVCQPEYNLLELTSNLGYRESCVAKIRTLLAKTRTLRSKDANPI